MQKLFLVFIGAISITFCSCQSPDSSMEEMIMADEIRMMEEEEDNSINTNQEQQAVITAVQVSGSENSYSFNVTIKSPDTGCQQYADWWEVFDQDGNLLYRRILGHSHVDEQPFTRSGGPVNISENQFIYVRAHMNTFGYGSFVFAGTIKGGLKAEMIGMSKASALEKTAPLPKDCAF